MSKCMYVCFLIFDLSNSATCPRRCAIPKSFINSSFQNHADFSGFRKRLFRRIGQQTTFNFQLPLRSLLINLNCSSRNLLVGNVHFSREKTSGLPYLAGGQTEPHKCINQHQSICDVKQSTKVN